MLGPETGYTVGYCTGNLIILTTTCLSLVYSVALLIWELQHDNSFKRRTTWIFVFTTMFLFQMLLRYTFNLYNLAYYPYLVVSNQFMMAIV